MKNQYNKSKVSKIVLCLFFICAAGYVFFMFWLNQRVVTVDVSACDTVAAERMKYKIEKINCKYDYVEITGYAYEPGVSVDTADTVLLAHDPVTDVYYKLPTENLKKTKLTKNANDGFNYDYAQFKSVTLQKKLPGGCRVCIWYRGNGENILIPTEEVIFY